MYEPADRWVWDFWLARDAEEWHLFHLQAPKSLHSDDRHWNATVGHATSTDLRNWTTAPMAISTGPAGSWDATAIWTGSVIRHRNGRWLMAYTGISREGGTAVERIGLAWSDDLVQWDKDPANPVLESDPRWYEQPGETTRQHGWRDPFLVQTSDGYAMLICARVRSSSVSDPSRAGAVALATSPDGCTWSVCEPIPGTSGHVAEVEVPQLLRAGGHWHLVFCTNTNGPWPREDPNAPTLSGTAAFTGPNMFGPFDRPPVFIDADDAGTRYAGRVFDTDKGRAYMAFLDGGRDRFRGAISDPLPVRVDPGTGRLITMTESEVQIAEHLAAAAAKDNPNGEGSKT